MKRKVFGIFYAIFLIVLRITRKDYGVKHYALLKKGTGIIAFA